MSRDYYAEINLHIVWHTKCSDPLLTTDLEAFVHRYLRGRLCATPGVFVHEVGGIETHLHLAISIIPSITISELIGELKGSSSHETNQRCGRGHKVLQWQRGYGVVSFGTRDLPWVQEYVRNQRQHHAQGTCHERLERITTLELRTQSQDPNEDELES